MSCISPIVQKFDQSAISIQPRPQVRATSGSPDEEFWESTNFCLFFSLLLIDRLNNIKPVFDRLKYIP